MIQNADLLNKKHLFKQSGMIENITAETEKINSAQSIIIYQLSKNTQNHLEKLYFKGAKLIILIQLFSYHLTQILILMVRNVFLL